MSGGYAERLTFRQPEALGGKLGGKETQDPDDVFDEKIDILCEMLQSSKGCSVYTGAGISTACGIPDFRGPNGIWTLQAQGKPLPKSEMTLELASPSLTHMAIAALVSRGLAKLVVSQNVDDLHRRSGLGSDVLAELHGNCFIEKCNRCKRVYRRDFEIPSAGFKFTGRRCETYNCRGRLQDFVLDWDDQLPEEDLLRAEAFARDETDVALCIGTSLRIAPACQIPLLTKKAGGKLVIVNLQTTPKDRQADLKISECPTLPPSRPPLSRHSPLPPRPPTHLLLLPPDAKSDKVMAALMRRLGAPIPTLIRTSSVVCGHETYFAGRGKRKRGKGGKRWTEMVRVFLSSVHGADLRIPLIDTAVLAVVGPSGKTVVPSDAGPGPHEYKFDVSGCDFGQVSPSLSIRLLPLLLPADSLSLSLSLSLSFLIHLPSTVRSVLDTQSEASAKCPEESSGSRVLLPSVRSGGHWRDGGAHRDKAGRLCRRRQEL